MTQAKLDAPLRVYWEINYGNSTGEARLTQAELLNVADIIIAGRPFYLNLGEDILNYNRLDELLGRFSGKGIQVSLSSSTLIDDAESISFLKKHKLDFLELKLDPHIDAINSDPGYLKKIATTLKVYSSITKKVCPSLMINADNYTMLPEIMDFLAEQGIKYFKMPNTVINESTLDKLKNTLLRADDIMRLKEILRDKVADYKSNIHFFIHDLFIFKIFFPTEEESKLRAEYGGCQAGNALSYIDQSADLYFCSALHVSFGNLLADDIKMLFKSDKRNEVKQLIDEDFPEKCTSCLDFKECRGGCRGVVYHLNESFACVDPLCPYIDE